MLCKLLNPLHFFFIKKTLCFLHVCIHISTTLFLTRMHTHLHYYKTDTDKMLFNCLCLMWYEYYMLLLCAWRSNFPLAPLFFFYIFETVFDSVVAGAFQITFHAKIHVNNVFLFFKNYFWHQHIKTIQNI